ncbi:hypothetical protein nACB1_074 [Acinetobacter phage nACB1]|nr:hypothetical protein nACB1_074 [Acinetobacter phage nACB1]
MIYQVHFPVMNPAWVLAFIHMLREQGYLYGTTEPSKFGMSYHVRYVYVNQERKLYLGKSDTPFEDVERTIIWEDNLNDQLKLVPEEVWQDYILGHNL